jgi:hypothetical protein
MLWFWRWADPLNVNGLSEHRFMALAAISAASLRTEPRPNLLNLVLLQSLGLVPLSSYARSLPS